MVLHDRNKDDALTCENKKRKEGQKSKSDHLAGSERGLYLP